MSTIKEVAELAKVAKSTVSNVLNNKKHVSADIRERVLAACEQLNYTPSFTASSLVIKKTEIIGLYLGTEMQVQDFYPNLIQSVTISAAEKNYKTLLYYSVSSQEMPKTFWFDKSLLDGAIFLTPLVDDFRIAHMQSHNVPFVLIGRSLKADAYYVDVDNIALTFEITQKLIKLGHRNILFFNGKPDYTISSDRLSGFTQALQLYNIKNQNCTVVHTDNEGRMAAEFLRKNINNFQYTAVIVPSDIVGAVLYPILAESNFKIGLDIAVVSLGGTSVAFELDPKLSTTKQNYDLIGKKAFDLLFHLMNHDLPDEKHFIIDSEIIFTDSCSPPKIID